MVSLTKCLAITADDRTYGSSAGVAVSAGLTQFAESSASCVGPATMEDRVTYAVLVQAPFSSLDPNRFTAAWRRSRRGGWGGSMSGMIDLGRGSLVDRAVDAVRD